MTQNELMASEVGIKVTQKGKDREEKQWCSNSLGQECVSQYVMTYSPVACMMRWQPVFSEVRSTSTQTPKFGHYPSLPGGFQNQLMSMVISSSSNKFAIVIWLHSSSPAIIVPYHFLFSSPAEHNAHNFLEISYGICAEIINTGSEKKIDVGLKGFSLTENTSRINIFLQDSLDSLNVVIMPETLISGHFQKQ